ncbi:hypothetical protein GCM10029978_074280 [Actinoallomurus acanthiterrae]
MVIRGYNVYPHELEEVLLTRADASLAVFVGIRPRTPRPKRSPSVSRVPPSTECPDRLLQAEMAAWK